MELKTDRGEAEVEIDASTGKVLEVELDDELNKIYKAHKNKSPYIYKRDSCFLFILSLSTSHRDFLNRKSIT